MKASLPPRRLIPRWRRIKSVLAMPEASFTRSNVGQVMSVDPEHLDDALAQWGSTPTTGLLGDILSQSISPPQRLKIIDWLKNEGAFKRAATVTQLSFIQDLLSDGPSGDEDVDTAGLRESIRICSPSLRREISTLRKILRANPANPLALLDLAQFQLAGGKPKRAEKSVLAAVSLSPNNRIALRTLARLYVHKREFDKAHDLISKHDRTKTDPWLMATEIALAELADTGSRFAKSGSKFAREKRAGNAHLSELAGALGGAELRTGNLKRAREMFRLALLAPNDNVMAQAITQQNMLGIDLSGPAERLAVMSAHEAQTLLAWNTLDGDNAERHGLFWHDEEPFSSRPLQFLTTLYASRREYSTAETLAKRGLIADPKEPALLANLAYIAACTGKLVEAEKILLKLLALKQPKYYGVILATAGLLQMQQSNWAAGDELYEAAMRIFREKKEFIQEALCCAYFARSAADTGHPNRDSILVRAELLYGIHGSPDAAIVLKQLSVDLRAEAKPELQRRLSQWIFDPKTESLIQIHGVTEPGAPALIVRT